MSNTGFLNKFLLAVAIVGVIATAHILWMRAQYERANDTVEIVVDLKTMRAAAPAGEPAEKIVRRLNRIGVRSVGIYEHKLEEMLFTGDARLIHGGATSRGNSISPDAESGGLSLSLGGNTSESRRMAAHVDAYFGYKSCVPDTTLCYIPDVGEERLKELSLGLKKTLPEERVVPRFFNTPFENETSIALKLGGLEKLPEPAIVIFDGESVLGYPDLLDATARGIIDAPGWNFGFVELTPQDGSQRLAKNLPGRVLPVHSISEAELAELPQKKAVARYRRAVRERGVRVLYVRPYPSLHNRTPTDALIQNYEYIEDIAMTVKEDGYTLGKAKPLGPFEMEYDYPVKRAERGLAIAGAVALVGLLAGAVLGVPAWMSLAAAAACLIGAMVLPAGLLRIMIKLAALGTACCVPALSVALFFLPREPGKLMPPAGAGRNLALLAASCAATLAGAAATAAMLSERAYFLRLDVFTGVKLAFLFPIVLLFFLYLKKTGMKLQEFFDSPVRYIEFGAGLALLGVMAIYMLRSGNEGPTPVGGFDSGFREFLEAVFLVRPRTKEFLIGHPALLLAGLFPAARGKYLPFVLLMLGVVGQVSLFNTFCHLHTPLDITWYRVCLGLALGVPAGLAARAFIPIVFRFRGK